MSFFDVETYPSQGYLKAILLLYPSS